MYAPFLSVVSVYHTDEYRAIIYGALFMMFGAFPIVYQEARGWNQGVGGLAFMGIMVGMLFAVAGRRSEVPNILLSDVPPSCSRSSFVR